MEGMDNGMARTGWRRAFKLQFYLQVMADLCDLVSEFKFYIIHTSLKQDGKVIVCDRSAGIEEGGQFSSLYRWCGHQLYLPIDHVVTPTEEEMPKEQPGDWIEDVGSVAEWDEEFQINLKRRIKKALSDDIRDEVISLGTTWIGKGAVVRQLCQRFTECIARRDFMEDRERRKAARGGAPPVSSESNGKGKERVNGDHAAEKSKTDVADEDDEEELERDTLQRILNDQNNWKERDRSSTRRLMVKMLAKQPPIIPPYVKLPFDAWKVAKEYVDIILNLFKVGELSCARYYCLAKEFTTGIGDRFLALGTLIVSPYRVLSLVSIYSLTLAQLDAVRMHKYMQEVDSVGYDYKDEADENEVVLPDGPWACPFCTYVNMDSKYKCDVCDNYRSTKRAEAV